MKKSIVITFIFILVFSSFSFSSGVYEVEFFAQRSDVKFTSSSPFYVFSYHGGQYSFKSSSNITIYVKKDGVWNITTSYQPGYFFLDSLSSLKSSIKSASYDIYTKSDLKDVFFSVPGVTEIIQKETEKILPALVGKMRTILPTGFGVLSAMLLIVLLMVYFRHFLHRSV